MHRPLQALLLVAALAGAIGGPALPASANEFCDKELGPMMQRTKSLNDQLAAIAKRKAPDTREKLCGTLTVYISSIRKSLDYMEQNKDFCGIPDAAIDGAKKGLAQTQTTRRKICVAAAQPQQQQQSGQPGRPAVQRPPVELRLQ
jgi:hypothetical protein